MNYPKLVACGMFLVALAQSNGAAAYMICREPSHTRGYCYSVQ